jgi:transcriptional regulator with XRE-family HTH domain
MDVRKEIGARLQKVRKEAGLSQEELAHEAGLDRTYISHVERGTRNPTVIVLFKIAKALKTTPSKILEGMKP